MYKHAIYPRPRKAEDQRHNRQHDEPSHHTATFQDLTLAAMFLPLRTGTFKDPRRLRRTRSFGPELGGLAHG
jgi:hypothetical protein